MGGPQGRPDGGDGPGQGRGADHVQLAAVDAGEGRLLRIFLGGRGAHRQGRPFPAPLAQFGIQDGQQGVGERRRAGGVAGRAGEGVSESLGRDDEAAGHRQAQLQELAELPSLAADLGDRGLRGGGKIHQRGDGG